MNMMIIKNENRGATKEWHAVCTRMRIGYSALSLLYIHLHYLCLSPNKWRCKAAKYSDVIITLVTPK